MNLEYAEKLAKKREALCKNTPSCPNCGETDQIQLFAWIDEVIWKCRKCHTEFGPSYMTGIQE